MTDGVPFSKTVHDQVCLHLLHPYPPQTHKAPQHMLQGLFIQKSALLRVRVDQMGAVGEGRAAYHAGAHDAGAVAAADQVGVGG